VLWSAIQTLAQLAYDELLEPCPMACWSAKIEVVGALGDVRLVADRPCTRDLVCVAASRRSGHEGTHGTDSSLAACRLCLACKPHALSEATKGKQMVSASGSRDSTVLDPCRELRVAPAAAHEDAMG